MDNEKKVLSYKDVSEMTGLNINTLYSYVRKQMIPHKRFSTRMVRFEKNEIETWWNEKRVPILKMAKNG